MEAETIQPAATGAKIARILTLLIRLGLGGILLWSGVAKLRQPYDFLSNVYQYELLGPKMGMAVAMILPWVEVVIGLCLLAGLFVGGALLGSILLAAVFTFAQASAMRRGLSIECGCFGSSSSSAEPSMVGYGTLLRAWGMFLAAITVYGCLLASRSAQPIPQRDGAEQELPIAQPAAG